MVEWSITAVLKTVELRGSGGSNPSLSANKGVNQRVGDLHPLLYPIIHFLFNIGVSEQGVLTGGVIFNSRGIEKSTPISRASPAPIVGKKDSRLLLSDEAALSTAFLSCSLISR